MTRPAVLPVAALLGATGLLVAVGWGGRGVDATVGSSFDKAVTVAAAGVRPAAEPASRADDTDLLKLSKADGPTGLPFGPGRTVGLGDKITIAGQDGVSRVLEVSEVRPIGAAGDHGPAMLLVTCTVRDGGVASTVRFVVEATGAPRPALHRAL